MSHKYRAYFTNGAIAEITSDISPEDFTQDDNTAAGTCPVSGRDRTPDMSRPVSGPVSHSTGHRVPDVSHRHRTPCPD